MKLSCESCGALIPADDINLERLVAKCRHCDSVFSFDGRLAGRVAPRRRPPLPKGLAIEKGEPPLPSEPTYRTAPVAERGPLEITRRWFRPHHLGLLFFCVFWDGFLVVWYSLGSLMHVPLLFFIFPLLHVAVGLGLTYSTLAGLVNRTFIGVADGSLSIRHAPLPWFGNRSIPVEHLRQLYVRDRVSRGQSGNSTTRWELLAETGDDRTLELVTGLPDRDQAEYLEWAIEEHLGIEDEPVPVG